MVGVLLEGGERGAGAEGEVLGLEHLLRDGGGGDDDDGGLAEAEVDQRTAEHGEAAEVAVSEGAHFVEVSEEGKPAGARGELELGPRLINLMMGSSS